MIRTEKSYIDGTAVRKIKYDVYEQNSVLKAKNKARQNAKVKLKLILGICVVFAAFGLLVYRYAIITDINYKINKMYAAYENIKNENIRLTVEINKGMDLERIRNLAETRLGMREPEKHQIVRLNVTKNDFTKVAANFDSRNSSIDRLLSLLKKRLEFIASWLY